MRTRLWRSLALASIAALVLSGITTAYDPPMDDGVLDSAKEVHGVAHHQHGGAAGHITVTNYNVDLVSKLELTTAEGRIADVGVWNGFAYLGAFRQDACGGPESGEPDGGVYVVDITDPVNPVKAGFIPIHQDSFAGEGIQALSISTPKFTGDLLVINAESCGKNDKGGFSLYNVTNPYKPMKLVENYGDFNVNLGSRGNDANDIHSAFVWEDDNNTGTDADDRAYVVMTDDFELTDTDIFDITDPRHPFMVGEWNLDVTFPTIIDPTLGPISGFLHDMVVKKIGSDYVMLLSYWDSGYVMLNVNDPANPTLIADTDYADPDPLSGDPPEGNGHEAEFTLDNAYVVAADEDFSPLSVTGTNTSDATPFILTTGTDTPQLPDGIPFAGDTVYVGQACPGGPAVPAAPATLSGTQIALVERAVCTFTEKVASVEAAGGYEAVVVFNRQGSDACSDLVTMLVTGGIPAFFVNRPTGLDFLDLAGYNEAACRAGTNAVVFPALGTVGDAVSFLSTFDGWGYVRLFSTTPVGDKLPELDQFAIPEAFDLTKASGFGDLSVHEAATSLESADIVYLSYYSGGFRVLQIVDDQLVEVGAWIDPFGDGDEGGNNFWGVQVFSDGDTEYVAASDRDFGLYIFEFTGP